MVVQAPISLITIVILQALGQSRGTILAIGLLGLLGTLFVYGAVVSAVGQHYVFGKVNIRSCYAVAWWRIVSLMMLVTIVLPLSLVLALLVVSEQSLVVALGLLMAIPAISIAVYWSMAVQAVVVEGRRTVGALRRSLALIRGSWWRIFGITLVLGLVAFGLSILVVIPFAIFSAIVNLDPSSDWTTALDEAVGLVVVIVVTPVLAIAGTLLYYDVRVRKEQYDFDTLSHEMGVAAV